VLALAAGFMLSLPAFGGTAGTWYSIRTNGVPQSPTNLSRGHSGDLWITSESGNEKGAWRWPAAGNLLHITGQSTDNNLGEDVNMLVKPELAGKDVTYVRDDAAGNTWYATYGHGVLVQKADNSWVTFSTTETGARTLADNHIWRIRFVPGVGTILVGPLGAYVVDSTWAITQQRTGIYWNNDHIQDAMKDSAGNWWVLTNRGPHRGSSLLNAAHVSTLYSGVSNVPANETPANRIEQDSSGNLWFIVNGYGGDGIYCLTSADVWEKYTAASVGVTGLAATDLSIAANGDVWFGLLYGNETRWGNGIARFRRGSGWWRVDMKDLNIQSYSVTSVELIGNKLWFTSGYNPDIPGNGTGVHYLTLDANGDKTGLQSYDYMTSSNTVPSNRCRAVAADKSGNVWFGAYDRTALSRRKANGTWETWNGTAGEGMTTFPINFGIAAIGVDSANIVYFVTHDTPPFAYNANTDQWMSLPNAGVIDYPYGLYIDKQDNKYFYGADGAYKLSADNSTWTAYPTTGPGTGLAQQYVDYGVRADRYGNVWFGTRGGLSMLSIEGTWTNFTGGVSGYPGAMGYKPVLDDIGEAWTTTGQKYDYIKKTWITPEDNTAWANRNITFPNGNVFMGTDRSRARGIVLDMTGSGLSGLDDDMMTLGLDGTVYQGQWAFSSDLGVIAFQPPADALSITPGSRNHASGISTWHEITVTANRAWSVSTSAPWIGIAQGESGAGDGLIRYALAANANPGAMSRSGTITVTTQGGLTQTFTVNQSGRDPVPTGELLTNPSFDMADGSGWTIATAATRATMFATAGEANMHVSVVPVKLLWQPVSVSNPGGMAFKVSMTLRSGNFPAGRSVAVYLDYVDATDVPQRLQVFALENSDISPSSSYFETQITLPGDAKQLTAFSVDRNGPGEFWAEDFSLQALGYARPIVSVSQLQAIGYSAEMPLNGNYLLLHNIDAYSTAFRPNGLGFDPIGGTLETPYPFTGSIDGYDNSIHNLMINRPEMNTVGLVRILAGRGAIRRVAMVGGGIRGRSDVGAFVGMNDNSTLLRCSSQTPVTGVGNVGGLIGNNHSGQIIECASLAPVAALDNGISQQGAAGGLAGLNMGMIRDSFAKGLLYADNHYSIGGVAGTNLGQGLIQRTYAAGPISADDTANIGGLVGDSMDSAFVQSSFWDTTLTGQTTSDAGTGKTPEQMMEQATFTGWDFAAVWDIREDLERPFLRGLITQIVPPVEITQAPVNATGNVGATAQFTVQAIGGLPPLAYRWQRAQSDVANGTKYAGASTATLTVNNLQLTDNGALFRVVVTDSVGETVTSAEVSLTVNSAPTAITQAATFTAATRADVAGQVNAFGLPTTVQFLWGLTSTTLNNTIDGNPNLLSNSAATPVSGAIFGLQPNKTYFYRISAQNSVGTTLGAVMSFKTPVAVAPLVTTLAATDITSSGAKLKGKVNPRGVEAFVGFDYGLTTTYGNGFPAEQHFVDGNTETQVWAVITGLQAHTKYNFRVHAHSDNGDANGGNLTFITLNNGPSAEPDTYEARPGGVLTLDVLDNDTDPDGDTLSLVSFTAPPAAAGRVTKVGNNLVFTAATTFPLTGTSFNYTMKDGFGGTDTATVTINFTGANINPETKSIASASISYPVTITTDGGWSAVESLSWVSVSPLSGYGDGTVTITVLPNAAKTQRTGTVVIAGIAHSITQAGVIAPQLIVPNPIPEGIVGGTYNLVIPTLNAPVIYTATNLPKGLSIVQATGTITGRPSEPGTKRVVIKAINAAINAAVSIEFDIKINPFPIAAGGIFTALVSANDGVNEDLGGHLSLTSTTFGSLSGTLKLGGKSLSINKAFWEVPLTGNPTATINLPRTGNSALALQLILTIADRNQPLAQLAGTLTELEPGGGVSTLEGWRHAWAEGSSPADLKAAYTAILEVPENVPGPAAEPMQPEHEIPDGPGYLTLTSSDKGAVSWTGKLADGTSFTGSATLWPNGRVPMFQSLYTNKGSILGAPSFVAPEPPSSLYKLSGNLHWLKKPQPVLLFPQGIDINLDVEGGEYLPPALLPPGSKKIVLDMKEVAAGQTNAMLQLLDGGINSASQADKLIQNFRVTAAHSTFFSTDRLVNPTGMKVTSINPNTGFFKGSLVLKDRIPIITRTVNFEGVLMTEADMGAGFFILSELPVAPATSTTNTPQHSGRVLLFPIRTM
jgi:hypothetical protein